MSPEREPGLRERKKRRTRELIAETARRFFVERGFDRVTVAEIAREAEVAEKTVFNYFPTKEDLVYWRLEEFEQELLSTVRDREPGESAVAAFARFVLAQRGLLAERDPATRERLAGITRMITESRALLAREQQIFDRYTESLATLLAEETRAAQDDVRPRVVAHALMGVHRALVDSSRRGIVAGLPRARIAGDLRTQAELAFGLLEGGLEGYAVKEQPARAAG